MLSAYELNGKVDHALLENAKRLGDKLMFAFTDDGPIPYGSLHFVNNTAVKLKPDVWVRLRPELGYRKRAEPAVLSDKHRGCRH